MMTKKYLLFAGNQYYPNGGAEDFIGFYDTVEHAQIASPRDDWAQIAEIVNGSLVIRHTYYDGKWTQEAE